MPTPKPSEGWSAAAALALAWGLGPALPALLRGELIGQPFTDLYPSVWGMWWFASEQPGFPTFCQQLNAPEGMPFYYSSPLHGWAAWPLIALLGVPAAWNFTVLLARVATVLCAYGAARAWSLDRGGALIAAAVYGASPFFHGYAVEGIVEGLDGWTLALWLWMLGRGRPAASAAAFALTVLSSWYMAATACVLAVFLGPRAWLSMLGGLALSAPALASFLGTFPDREALEPEMRAAMGLHPTLRPPGLSEGLNPFAITTWVGTLAPILAIWALRRRDRTVLIAAGALALCLVLSTGRGPWNELPPLSALRFPYRFHAGTLAALAYLAGRSAGPGGLAWLIAAEGLLLSPIEPVLPGSPAEVPAIYRNLPTDLALLDLPGPVAMPPGQINHSRPRARWFLYAQTAHGRASPWAPDFNGVGVAVEDGLDDARALDPLARATLPAALALPDAIGAVVVHRAELRQNAALTEELLAKAGFERTADDGQRSLWLRPQRGSR